MDAAAIGGAADNVAAVHGEGAAHAYLDDVADAGAGDHAAGEDIAIHADGPLGFDDIFPLVCLVFPPAVAHAGRIAVIEIQRGIRLDTDHGASAVGQQIVPVEAKIDRARDN